MSVPEPSFPPPPPPMGVPSAPVTAIPSNGYINGPQDTGGGGRGPPVGGEEAQPSFDEWDDEWDDDDESSNSTVGTSGGQVLLLALGFCVPKRDLNITSERILYEDECRAERERGRETVLWMPHEKQPSIDQLQCTVSSPGISHRLILML